MQCACLVSYRYNTCAVLAGGHYKSGSHAPVACPASARARSRTAPRSRSARVRQTETADDCQRGGASSSRESSPGRPREVGLRCKRSASRPRAGLELLEKWARCAALCAVPGSAGRQRRPQEQQQQPPAWPPPPRRQPLRLQPPKGGQGNRGADFPADFRSVCGFTCPAIKMMSMNSKQPHFAMHPTLPEHKYPSLHSSSEAIRRACLPTPPVSAPRPRSQPAHSSPPRLRDAACRVLVCAKVPVRGFEGRDFFFFLKRNPVAWYILYSGT